MALTESQKVVESKKHQSECGSAARSDNKYSAEPVSARNNTDIARSVPPWQENPAERYSPDSQGDPAYAQIQVGTRRELLSALSIELPDDSIYRIATGKQAPLNGPFDILIIGDPIHKPLEIAVIPELQTLEPGEEIFVSVMCLDYPYWLSVDTPIAQAFLLLKGWNEEVPESPEVLWVQIMGCRKLITKCTLFSKGEKIKRRGMMDTGADVTLIARSKWPSDWEVEPISGFISGIGGLATSWRAKRNVVIAGPEGKIATVRPFVVRASIMLWGRDVLSQWGAVLSINPRDF